MSNINKAILRAALKGKGVCPNVKAGQRRQFQWRDTKDESSDPLSDIIELIKWSDNNIITDFLCNEVGGYYIEQASIEESNKCLHSQMGKLFSKMSGVVSTVTESAEDKIITTCEISHIKESLNDFMKAAQELIEDAEKGYWLQ
jgi:hypothetical protein